MENLFDSVQDTAFDIVTNTMGYAATWTPSTGGAQQTARVLFNKPTEKRQMIAEDTYEPRDYTMEYKEGDFADLKPAVDLGRKEIVAISGSDYYVRSVKAKFDGKNLLATLEPKL